MSNLKTVPPPARAASRGGSVKDLLGAHAAFSDQAGDGCGAFGGGHKTVQHFEAGAVEINAVNSAAAVVTAGLGHTIKASCRLGAFPTR